MDKPLGELSRATLEQKIVGILMCHEHMFPEVSKLLPAEAFFDPRWAWLYSGMQDTWEDTGALDPAVVAATMENQTLAANHLAVAMGSIAGYAPLYPYVKRLLKFHRLDSAQQAIRDYKASDGTPEDTQTLSDALSAPQIDAGDKQALGDVLAQVAAESRSGPPADSVRLGFPELDGALCGLHPGEMVVLAARPGAGKTTFGLQAVLNVAKSDIETLMVSLEMTREELAQRVLANLARVDSSRIRDRTVSEADQESMTAAVREVKKLPLHLECPVGLNMASLRTMVRQYATKGVKFVVVDYMGLIRGEAKMSAYERMSMLSTASKQMAMEFKVAVLMVAQLNREVEKRGDARPRMSDLRDSGQIEQDADAIVMLWNPPEGRDAAPVVVSSREVIASITKNRHGPTAETKISFDQTCFRMTPGYGAYEL